MPVTEVVRDPDALTLTVTARFDAPIERVWQVWSDPRQLERWWGPPDFPATVTEHELVPGGAVAYFMTGPDGVRHGGWFGVRAVDAPRALEVETAFADADGTPLRHAGTATMRVTLSEVAGDGTQMVIATAWDSPEAMEQMLATGMEAGLAAAAGQIDALLEA